MPMWALVLDADVLDRISRSARAHPTAEVSGVGPGPCLVSVSVSLSATSATIQPSTSSPMATRPAVRLTVCVRPVPKLPGAGGREGVMTEPIRIGPRQAPRRYAPCPKCRRRAQIPGRSLGGGQRMTYCRFCDMFWDPTGGQDDKKGVAGASLLDASCPVRPAPTF